LLKQELPPHDVDFVMDFIRRHGGIVHAQDLAEGLVQEAKRCLDILPSSAAKDSLLGLADYIIERDY
jgi:geranylgeranyl diphosphate synthase type I